ncbi:MAG: BlaI/MecI/CopY family transcriptional regulator [Oscillospiraceae bacterium]
MKKTEETKQYSLCESEYRFAEIVWKNAPLNSGELVVLCEKSLGWKKSTTYTVLKKLCDRGIFQNDKARVTAVVLQEQVKKYQSEQFINEKFGGSLPQFIAAFMGDKKISSEEAEQLIKLIDGYKEG